MGVARLPPSQTTLMMDSLVQPEEGLSGGRRGRDPPEGRGQCLRARGENCSGRTQWTSGCPGVPTGTSGSDPPGRCRGCAQKAAPGGMQGSTPMGNPPWQSQRVLWSQRASRRHLRQQGVHRPGQPATSRRQSRQQEKFRVNCSLGAAWAHRLGTRCPPGLGHCSLQVLSGLASPTLERVVLWLAGIRDQLEDALGNLKSLLLHTGQG